MFVVVGQILILVGWLQNWNWARSFWLRFLHLVTIVIVVVQSWLGQLCPLTIWEQQLRAVAGKPHTTNHSWNSGCPGFCFTIYPGGRL